MSKVAVVGVEGSGKTVLMAALGEKYSKPDEFGTFLSPESQDANGMVDVLMEKMRGGEWPARTDPNTMEALDWSVQRQSAKGAAPVKICDLTFLDYGGEIYRRTFGDVSAYDAAQHADHVSALREYVGGADVLLILIKLGDVIDGSATDREVRERRWLSKSILDKATRDYKIKKIALVFTQIDAYRDIIDKEGGLQRVYQKYLRHVANAYPYISLFGVTAVNHVVSNDNGDPVPAPDFQSEGLEEVLEWVVKSQENGRGAIDSPFADETEMLFSVCFWPSILSAFPLVVWILPDDRSSLSPVGAVLMPVFSWIISFVVSFLVGWVGGLIASKVMKRVFKVDQRIHKYFVVAISIVISSAGLIITLVHDLFNWFSDTSSRMFF